MSPEQVAWQAASWLIKWQAAAPLLLLLSVPSALKTSCSAFEPYAVFLLLKSTATTKCAVKSRQIVTRCC
jgi:hypothetical protein